MIRSTRFFTLYVILVAFIDLSSAAKKPDYDLENWMGQLSTLLENKKISEIVMPGTHNSGSYPISVGSRQMDGGELADILEQYPANPWIRDLVRLVGPGWAKCQDHSILEQLNIGNRFLDLGVYCDEETDEYYLEQSFIGSNLTKELLHIAEFVQSHEKELVILDLKSLHNCKAMQVNQLLERIEKLFNERPARPSDSMPTYGQLMADGTSVVVTMSNFDKKRFDWVWDKETRVNKPYLATPYIEKLKSFITTTMSEPRKPKSLFVSQIILTPTIDQYAAGIARVGPVNLREMALDLNRQFLRWIEEFQQLQPNIFSLDFLTETLSRRVINMNFDGRY